LDMVRPRPEHSPQRCAPSPSPALSFRFKFPAPHNGEGVEGDRFRVSSLSSLGQAPSPPRLCRSPRLCLIPPPLEVDWQLGRALVVSSPPSAGAEGLGIFTQRCHRRTAVQEKPAQARRPGRPQVAPQGMGGGNAPEPLENCATKDPGKPSPRPFLNSAPRSGNSRTESGPGPKPTEPQFSRLSNGDNARYRIFFVKHLTHHRRLP
jgi:hypothetical protein